MRYCALFIVCMTLAGCQQQQVVADKQLTPCNVLDGGNMTQCVMEIKDLPDCMSMFKANQDGACQTNGVLGHVSHVDVNVVQN